MTREITHDPLRRLGQAAATLSLKNLPAEVLQRAKQRVLDTIGCLVAGYNAGISDAIRSYVLAQGGKREATFAAGCRVVYADPATLRVDAHLGL